MRPVGGLDGGTGLRVGLGEPRKGEPCWLD